MASESHPVHTWTAGAAGARDDAVAVEEPLEIQIRGRSLGVTMRTPGHDEELAVGFLVAEGVVQQRRDIVTTTLCPRDEFGNTITVTLHPECPIDFDALARSGAATSSCGLCGRISVDFAREQFGTVTSSFTIDAVSLARLPAQLRTAQPTFERTGGLHAAAIADAAGTLLTVREDIGRHNAVDKVLGRGFLDETLPFDAHVLLVSGRVSFEIMQKALAAQVPVIAAISAPSSLAIRFAQESGQTLVGFLRDERLNVYTHPERVIMAPPQP